MDFEHLFAGTVILGAVGTVFWSCWAYVKLVFWRIINLLIVKARFGDYAGQALTHYCWYHLKRSPFGEKEYGGFLTFVQPVGRAQAVGYELSGKDFTVFWDGWRPIVVYMEYPAGNQGGHLQPMAITALFIRGMFDGDSLLLKALDTWNHHRHQGDSKGSGRFRVNRLFGRLLERRRGGGGSQGSNPDIFNRVKGSNEEIPTDRRYLKWTLQDLGTSAGEEDPFSTLALPENAQLLLEKIRQWIKSEKWYRKKRIPWRLGCLFFGPPGTAKSSVARAIGQEFDLPINSFDLSTFGNEDFVQEWNNVLSSTPCIMLIEDADATFDGRTNLGGEGALTFDCLLNCISGVKEADGVLVIITTNRPECLDEALGKPSAGLGGISSRPGRIDYVLELGTLDEVCRRKIAERILDDCPEHIDRVVRESEGFTGAQIQNKCEQIALAEYWASDAPNQQGEPDHVPTSGELIWSRPEPLFPTIPSAPPSRTRSSSP